MRTKGSWNRRIPVPQKAVEKVVEYLQDEKKHFEESDKPSNHIWKSVRKLEKELEAAKEWEKNRKRASRA